MHLILAAALASALVPTWVKGDIPPYATPTFCTSSQSCWPTAAQWSTLNTTVGGRLAATRPWSSVCYVLDPTYDITKCQDIQNSYLNGTGRSNYPGSMQSLNWEECNGQNCWLQSLLPGTPQAVDVCYQGRISPYSVAVTSSADIQAAVSFANQYKVKMVIKNTGHEYQGRSSGPDTLQIWTHKLNSISISNNYTPDGGSASGPAAVIGSGVQAETLYRTVADAGYTITLGAFGSVGVGGGFAMGGGHGPLGPKYGLAVDNILQYRVVTANGTVLTANANQNTDLYYALRGGGGGVFGIVYELTYAIHPPSQIQMAQITVSPSLIGSLFSDAALTDYLATLASYQTGWSNSGWAGYLFIYPSNISFTYAIPSSDAAGAQAQMAPWFSYLKANTNYVITQQAQTTFPRVQDYIEQVMAPAGQPNTPVGFGERLSGRLIPRSLFANNASQQSLAAAIVKGKQINAPLISPQTLLNLIKPVPLQIYSTGPANQPDNSKTGVTPAWRGSLWEVVYSSGWTQLFPQVIKELLANSTSAAAGPLRDLTPGGGDYYSESDVLEADWQDAFFGTNYQTLLNIKQKYDPQNILNVWKGVGWTGQSDSAYKCYSQA